MVPDYSIVMVGQVVADPDFLAGLRTVGNPPLTHAAPAGTALLVAGHQPYAQGMGGESGKHLPLRAEVVVLPVRHHTAQPGHLVVVDDARGAIGMSHDFFDRGFPVERTIRIALDDFFTIQLSRIAGAVLVGEGPSDLSDELIGRRPLKSGLRRRLSLRSQAVGVHDLAQHVGVPAGLENVLQPRPDDCLQPCTWIQFSKCRFMRAEELLDPVTGAPVDGVEDAQADGSP